MKNFKAICLFLTIPLLVGCSGSDNAYFLGTPAQDVYYLEMSAEREYGIWIDKYADWQERESAIEHPITQENLEPNDILEIAERVYRDIEYVSDEEVFGEDYWQTSDEVEQDGFADCDGYAVKIFREVYDRGYDPDRIGIVTLLCLKPDGQRVLHAAFAVWPDKEDDKTFLVVMRSEYKACYPATGCNLTDCWKFKQEE